MKFLKITICCILIVSVFSLNAFAFSGSTYADLSQSSSNVDNLISYAYNFDSFIGSDYVVFQDSQYSYYIFWGDLKYEGSRVTSEEAEYIRYYREGSGVSYSYSYEHSEDVPLSLTVNKLVVSNIDELGSVSSLYEDLNHNYRILTVFVILLAFIFVLMALAFRRTFKT